MADLVGEVRPRALRALPLTLALAMLAVVVLAGLLPDTGVVSAASNCTYGKCPAATPFPLWAVSAAVVVVVVAILLGLLLLRRRRRPPTASAPPGGPETGVAETAPSPDEGSGDANAPSSESDEMAGSPDIPSEPGGVGPPPSA